MPEPIDASELAELLDRHAARLQWYAAQWTSSPEDCVQEALIELARQLQRPGSVLPWLYRVVRNKALNAARAERRRTHYETGAGFRERCESLSEDDRLSLPEALAALPLADREIVVLRNWSELAWQEIADLAGTSSSSAQRTYVAALEKLKQLLEAPCPTSLTSRRS